MKIRKVNYQEQATPALSFISQDQLYEIHMATLEVLERVGVQVDEDEARKMLREAGAYVKDKIVKIPAHLVEEALRTAPPRVVLANREGERALFLEKNQTYYGLGSDLPYTIDLETGQRRRSVKQDVINAAKILDYLPNYDFMMSFAIATNVSNQLSYLHQFEAMVTNTKKPIVFTARDQIDFLQIVEIAAAVTGGYDQLREKPFLACYHEPICPMTHTRDGVQKLFACADYGIPAVYTPGMGAGGNSPCTMAGLLTQANVELLSGLVIHQLRKKGAPFIYGGCPSIMDMATTIFPYGCPEWHMNSVVLSQMARFYELPIFSTGGCSDAMIFDQQAGMEIGFSLLMAELSGANLIHDVGYLESGLTGSLESMVACNEVIGLVRRISRGYTINKDTLAVEVMERVGPGGSYFGDAHTFKHYKNEFWMPELLNRKRYQEWMEGGALTLGDKVKNKAQYILKNYQSEKLPENVLEQIKGIMNKAEQEIKNL
ncbi:trimethylamine methyltransferase [Candidatus Formimonas warabiya]|uniref:Trimethylamine methyltransferase n=2 Tax=Formimonas warabiya TaxID=1761012 RepID=A0A3G1KVI1_FORW1|nr:trimethylamine methyltransferase [Candidatus Formimonas warabiya]